MEWPVRASAQYPAQSDLPVRASAQGGNMWFLILSGIVAFLGGVLFLFLPKTLQQLSDRVNSTINKISVPIDDKVYKLRIGVGVSLLLVAGMLFFVVYYLMKKYAV